jgi:hypothetical protein
MFCLPISTFMYLWAIYIFLGLVCLFCWSQIGRPILGIYKSFTDTWMWELGTRPRSFISGNTEIRFLLQCRIAGQLYRLLLYIYNYAASDLYTYASHRFPIFYWTNDKIQNNQVPACLSGKRRKKKLGEPTGPCFESLQFLPEVGGWEKQIVSLLPCSSPSLGAWAGKCAAFLAPLE